EPPRRRDRSRFHAAWASPSAWAGNSVFVLDGLGLGFFVVVAEFVVADVVVEILEHRRIDIVIGDFVILDDVFVLFLGLGLFLFGLLVLVRLVVLLLVGIGRQLLDVVVLFLFVVLDGRERRRVDEGGVGVGAGHDLGPLLVDEVLDDFFDLLAVADHAL